MSFGDSIQRRADLLRKRGADVDRILRETCKGAADRAVAAAQDKTPPSKTPPERKLKHPSKATGTLKAHWATDSKTKPIRYAAGDTVQYVSILANDMEYASYVDQGHRIVAVTKGGPKEVGFIPGLFMVQAGQDAFEVAVQKELSKLLLEVFKP